MLIPIVLGVLLTFAVGLPQVHVEIPPGEWALVAVTLLLVVATLLLVAVTWRLVTGADRSARKQLRAYISIEPKGIGDYRPGDRVVPRVSFHNTGSVFAKYVATSINCALSDDGDRKDFDEGEVSGNNIIAPRGRILRGSDKPIPTQEIDDARIAAEAGGKQLYLYVWGIVRYHDGFTAGRFTRYCHRYNFSGLDKGTYSFTPERYRYHHHGNEIDIKD
jgi:hypothetical protein